MATAKPRAKTGRPTAYDAKRHPVIALAMRRLGATYEELATALGVSTVTLWSWGKRHKEFLSALNEGKADADGRVEASLYKRALGYDLKETTRHEEQGPTGAKTFTRTRTEHLPPDVTAQIFWLKNRKPVEWRDKQEHEVTGADGQPLQFVISRPGRLEPSA